MIKKQLIPGKLYNIQLNDGKIYPLYFLEIAEEYDHDCDCCGKHTLNGFIFCTKFYGTYEQDEKLYQKSWDSGVYFIGGSACLKKFVNEI